MSKQLAAQFITIVQGAVLPQTWLWHLPREPISLKKRHAYKTFCKYSSRH
jgi:hypothetical protein